MGEDSLALLTRLGVDGWNAWRREHPNYTPNLYGQNLIGLFAASPEVRTPASSSPQPSDQGPAPLVVWVGGGGKGIKAQLQGIDLRGARLGTAFLEYVDLTDADLTGADLDAAVLTDATLDGASLENAVLHDTNLRRASMKGTNLRHTNMMFAQLNDADLRGADLEGSDIYGVSAWNIRTNEHTSQVELQIQNYGEPPITVDNLEVAQFIYLLLHNEKIRDVIDTIGAKGVLILGRFGERKPILDRLRNRLRELGFAPMVFDFEKPESKHLTGTIRTLAGISAFIVADITKPRSVPQEAQAVVPDLMVPFVPIVEAGEDSWSMFADLWIQYRDWVFEPLEYDSIDELIPKLGSGVVQPALERRKVLLARRAEEMGKRSLDDYAADADSMTGPAG